MANYNTVLFQARAAVEDTLLPMPGMQAVEDKEKASRYELYLATLGLAITAGQATIESEKQQWEKWLNTAKTNLSTNADKQTLATEVAGITLALDGVGMIDTLKSR